MVAYRPQNLQVNDLIETILDIRDNYTSWIFFLCQQPCGTQLQKDKLLPPSSFSVVSSISISSSVSAINFIVPFLSSS